MIRAQDDALAAAPLRVPASPRVERWHLAALSVVVALSLAYRLHVSNECSLWLDEASTTHDSYAPWPELLRGPSREHPPLMFWLVRLVTALFGRGDTAVRSVSLFFGCVLLVAVYFLCLELRFTATRALVPVAWLAFTPFFIRQATEARQYAIVGAFTTLAAVFALRLLQGPLRTSSLIGFAVCSVAAAATHFFALGYALALWGALAVGTARSWRLRALPARRRAAVVGVVGGSLLLFGVLAAEIFSLVHYYSAHTLHGTAHHHLAPAAVWQQFSFMARPAWDPAIEALVSACGLLLVLVRRRGIAGMLPLALAFAPVAVADFALSGGHMLTPRYLWPSFVFYQLGEAAAVLGLVDLLEFGLARVGALVRAGAFARPLSLLGWLVLLVPLHARLSEYPAGFSAGGPINYRGLQAYFRGPRADDTALVVFVGYAGLRIMGSQYPVPRLQALEDFQPIPGITRYLVAEFGSSDRNYQAKFAALLKRSFGLSLGEWRALRPVRLAGSAYQRPAKARLVLLDADAPARKERPPAPERTTAAPSAAASDGENSGLGDDGEDNGSGQPREP